MATLNDSQVWLVFRDQNRLRALYPWFEAQDPHLLQSVDAGQPLLFQPEKDLPLWVISDFADTHWAEVIERQPTLKHWLVLTEGEIRTPISPARYLDLQQLKQWLGSAGRPVEEVQETGVWGFDHRLADGEWMVCKRRDTTLVRYESGLSAARSTPPVIGTAVENWLIPEDNKNLRSWFDKVGEGDVTVFHAVRWQNDEERGWVEVRCMPIAGQPEYLQCLLVDRSGQVRLESGLSLLNRGTQLGTLVQMQQLLSELSEWAEADYAAVLMQDSEGLTPDLLAEAGPLRPGESQWIHLGALMQRMQSGKLQIPERADLLLADNPFIAEHGLESVLVWEIEQEQQGVLAALVLAAHEPMQDWRNLIRLVSVLARVLGQELNLQAMRNLVHHQKTLDRLTGLPDRVGLIQDVHELAVRKEQAGLLLLQLDGMDTLQQAHTHEELDLMMRQLARILRAMENPSVRLYRPIEGGFALLLQGSWQREQVKKLANTLQRLLENGIHVPGMGEQVLSASMGFVAFPEHADRPRELMRRAQLVVNEARRQGGGRCLFYDQDLGRVQLEKGRLLKDLPTALKQEQFLIHYQPKVSSETEDIVGMEALVRWQHPELGMISPAVFIPLAEESEWIVELGEYILQRSCFFTQEMNRRFGLELTVGVNVAQRQLLEPPFLEHLQRTLKDSGLPPHQLDIEVTETQRLLDQTGVSEALAQIRALGCTVAIDDFGTGQSTLEDLRKIPADHVKLDQSFVRNVGVDPHDEAIIRATVEMCHELGLKLVAEGVETEQQFRFLRELGCQVLQGYLFSRPLADKDFHALLEAREHFIARHQTAQPEIDRDWMN